MLLPKNGPRLGPAYALISLVVLLKIVQGSFGTHGALVSSGAGRKSSCNNFAYEKQIIQSSPYDF